jgi:hypothetical protein
VALGRSNPTVNRGAGARRVSDGSDAHRKRKGIEVDRSLDVESLTGSSLLARLFSKMGILVSEFPGPILFIFPLRGP